MSLRAASSLGAGFKFIGSDTWANVQANWPAASYAGYSALVTDVGVPALHVYSDGTRWQPIGVQVLARSAVPINGPDDTNENTLVTFNIPGNLLGINGGLRLRMCLSSTNSANTKTYRVRWSGGAGTAIYSPNLTTQSIQFSEIWLRNTASASNQNCDGWSGTTINSANGTAVNTAVDQTLVLTVQKTLSTEVAGVRDYVLEIVP